MTLSVRTRFEVFKRDRFTCSYCGKTPPNVLLEVDHVVPKAAGGTNDITNLTTSCQECNRGKSAGPLEEGTTPVVGEAAVEDLRERLEQAQAYTELVAAQQALMEKQRQMVADAWAKGFSATVEEREDGTFWVLDNGQFPNMRSVRVFLRRLPVHEILAAVEITSSKFDEASYDACRFFYGICWHRIRGESGPIDGPRQVVPDDSEWRATLAYTEDQHVQDLQALARAQDEIGELRGQVSDLSATVRRFRESTGRDV